jgi:hypothetical protein
MSRYHSTGDLPDALDVAYDMGGIDIRVFVDDPAEDYGETYLQPDEARRFAQALLTAADECERRRG